MNNMDSTEILFEQINKLFKKSITEGSRPPFILISCSVKFAELRGFINEVVLYSAKEPRLNRLIGLSNLILSEWKSEVYPLPSERSTINEPACWSIDNEGAVFIKMEHYPAEKWINLKDTEYYSWDKLMRFTNEVNGYLRQKTGIVSAQTGLHTDFSISQIEAFYDKMKLGYIKADKSNFMAVFKDKFLPDGWQKINWIGSRKNCFSFMMDLCGDEIKAHKINEYFMQYAIDSKTGKPNTKPLSTQDRTGCKRGFIESLK